MAQTLAAMEEFQRKRQDEDEALRLEIDAIIHSINKYGLFFVDIVAFN